MEPADTQRVILVVVGVLCVTALWVLPLIIMAVWLSRRAAADKIQVAAAWQAVGQEFGLALQKHDGPFHMEGVCRGRPLAVDGRYGSRHSSGSTQIKALLDFQADVYFRVTRHATAGVPYVPSGDAELDRIYHFLSRPPDLTRQLVGNNVIRNLLVQASPLGLTLTPREITLLVWDVEKNQPRLRAMIELVSAVTGAAQSEIERNLVQPPLSEAAYRDLGQTMPTIRLSRSTTWLVLGLLLVGFLCLLTILLVVAFAPVVQTFMEMSG